MRKQRLEYLLSFFLGTIYFLSNLYSPLKVGLILSVLFLVGIFRNYRLFDAFVICLLAFLSLDALHRLFHGNASVVEASRQVLLPAAAYLCAKWLGMVSKSVTDVFAYVFSVGLSLAFFTILSIATSVATDGFTGLSRSIALIGIEGDDISATVLGGYLIIMAALTGVLLSGSSSVGWIWKTLMFLLVMTVLVCAARLGSRTLLFVVAASAICGLRLNSRAMSKKISGLLVLSLLPCFIVLSYLVAEQSVLISYFEDRLNSSEAGVATFGGRSGRWFEALILLVQNPFGWPFSEIGYAHNFWLDVARTGGWISLLLLIVFSVVSFRVLQRAYNGCGDNFLKTLIVSVSVSFALLFFVEPVLDGFIYPFAAYCAFVGCINGYIKQMAHAK